MNILPSEKRLTAIGYLLMVTCLYSILYISTILETHYFNPSPPYQDVIWANILVMFLALGIPVAVGHYFGRVSYIGVALCMFVFLVVPAQFFSYKIASQFGDAGSVTITTTWYQFITPSLVAVVTLYVCRYITNRLSRTPNGAA